ncbi:hypothetical protein PUN28_017261 [Cardiocondyla obscurior]|uniref:Ribosomal protein S10 n=1 Tax=Cardiocondyla obscurior TaxID=286306 RepID=A0AAW2EN50_9HYME
MASVTRYLALLRSKLTFTGRFFRSRAFSNAKSSLGDQHRDIQFLPVAERPQIGPLHKEQHLRLRVTGFCARIRDARKREALPLPLRHFFHFDNPETVRLSLVNACTMSQTAAPSLVRDSFLKTVRSTKTRHQSLKFSRPKPDIITRSRTDITVN